MLTNCCFKIRYDSKPCCQKILDPLVSQVVRLHTALYAGLLFWINHITIYFIFQKSKDSHLWRSDRWRRREGTDDTSVHSHDARHITPSPDFRRWRQGSWSGTLWWIPRQTVEGHSQITCVDAHWRSACGLCWWSDTQGKCLTFLLWFEATQFEMRLSIKLPSLCVEIFWHYLFLHKMYTIFERHW